MFNEIYTDYCKIARHIIMQNNMLYLQNLCETLVLVRIILPVILFIFLNLSPSIV